MECPVEMPRLPLMRKGCQVSHSSTGIIIIETNQKNLKRVGQISVGGVGQFYSVDKPLNGGSTRKGSSQIGVLVALDSIDVFVRNSYFLSEHRPATHSCNYTIQYLICL